MTPDAHTHQDSAAAQSLRESLPPILTTGQVAAALSCSVAQVRDLIRTQDLPAVRWGHQYRIMREALIEFLDASSTIDSAATRTAQHR